MTRALLTATGLLLVGLAVSACTDHKSGGTAVVTPLPPPAAFETQFGPNFALAYQANANSEPRAVSASDVIPLSLTAEPTALPK
jgi:hypothetical protein